jgi:hypothetical protein
MIQFRRDRCFCDLENDHVSLGNHTLEKKRTQMADSVNTTGLD